MNGQGTWLRSELCKHFKQNPPHVLTLAFWLGLATTGHDEGDVAVLHKSTPQELASVATFKLSFGNLNPFLSAHLPQ